MTKILLVEDHPVMRTGTRHLLHSFIASCQITEVDNFKRALNAVTGEKFSLVVLDVAIPGGNSVRMVENIKNRRADQKILIYTSSDEDLYALTFIKAGANGFLSKNATEQEFKQAVELVLFQDKVYLSEKIKDQSLRLFMQAGKTIQEADEKLSLREREIVQLFLAGKGVTEIGNLLNLHTSTVSTHRARIFNKLGVDNMMDLARKLDMLH